MQSLRTHNQLHFSLHTQHICPIPISTTLLESIKKNTFTRCIHWEKLYSCPWMFIATTENKRKLCHKKALVYPIDYNSSYCWNSQLHKPLKEYMFWLQPRGANTESSFIRIQGLFLNIFYSIIAHCDCYTGRPNSDCSTWKKENCLLWDENSFEYEYTFLSRTATIILVLAGVVFNESEESLYGYYLILYDIMIEWGGDYFQCSCAFLW